MSVTHGVVAAGDPQTSEAGAHALRAGGNAVDAAIAAAFAAFVCELPLASPMGGGVMVAGDGSSKLGALDFFARTPGLGVERGDLDFKHVEVDFGATTQIFHIGRASAAVPVALPGLIEAQRRWGKLPLTAVVEPAVTLAREGYELGPGVAYVFKLLEPIVTLTPAARALHVDGNALATAGARLHNRDLADSLERVAAEPARMRELYAALADELGPRHGGLITPTDVERARVVEVEPVVVDRDGYRLTAMGAPSSGGVLVALGFALLALRGTPFLSAEHVVALARLQDTLLDVRDEQFDEHCRDPRFVAELLAQRAGTASRRPGKPGTPLGSTTHVSALDEEGGVAALTLTNGEGSGHVLAGTGMHVNNLMGEEDLHPRGFHMDAPGTPLATMMAPTVLEGGGRTVALGSGGSNRLRNAILSVLAHLVEHDADLDTAVWAPRIHLEAVRALGRDASGRFRRQLAFERAGLPEDAAIALRAAYPDAPVEFPLANMFFGGVHAALRHGFELSGAGDPRRGGSVSKV